MSTFLININGEFFDESNAKVSVFDRGFLYGDSVYETTRTFSKKAFRIEKHLDRLFTSAHKLDFIPRLTQEEILDQILLTIEKSPFENVTLRIVLTRGTNSDLGLAPNLSNRDNLIIFTKEILPNPTWWYDQGVKIISYKKKSSTLGSYAKSGNYQENVMAMQKAHEVSCYEALMINEKNFVTECSTSNIWLIKDGVLKTPSIDEGLLAGLTRDAVLSVARQNHYNVEEVHLLISDFLNADEVFLTSTNRDLVPVIQIDQSIISKGIPGPLTQALLKLYRQYVHGKTI
jgi:branched-chain amino acid aminotransferase